MEQSVYESISEEFGEELVAAGQTRVPVVTCTVDENPLTETDLARYVERNGDLPAPKSDEKDLAVLRARHQQVARLLATGMPEGVVAQLTGYTPSTISTLKNNPSMIELIAHYRAPGNAASEVIAEKLRLLADMSLEQLLAKAAAGELDANQLLAGAKLGADRSGNGPMAKIEHQHHHALDDETVRKIAETARKKNADRIIDIHAVRQALPAPRGEPDADA